MWCRKWFWRSFDFKNVKRYKNIKIKCFIVNVLPLNYTGTHWKMNVLFSCGSVEEFWTHNPLISFLHLFLDSLVEENQIKVFFFSYIVSFFRFSLRLIYFDVPVVWLHLFDDIFSFYHFLLYFVTNAQFFPIFLNEHTFWFIECDYNPGFKHIFILSWTF